MLAGEAHAPVLAATRGVEVLRLAGRRIDLERRRGSQQVQRQLQRRAALEPVLLGPRAPGLVVDDAERRRRVAPVDAVDPTGNLDPVSVREIDRQRRVAGQRAVRRPPWRDGPKRTS